MVYLNKSKNLKGWKVRRIIKKLEKIRKNEDVAVVLPQELNDNKELIEELKKSKFTILNRKMDF